MRWMMALLAGLGCCALGLAVAGAASQRMQMLAACEQALRCIRTGICLRGEVLADVLRGLPAADAQERAWAYFFGVLGEALALRPSALLAEEWVVAWRQAAAKHPPLRTLSEEDTKLLSPLWEELGRTPRTAQEALLDHVMEAVAAHRAHLREKLEDTRRMSRTLGMLGGLALFLLLI